MAPTPIYRPSPDLRTPLDDFKAYVNQKYGLSISTYAELHAFSVDRLNDFWMAVWEHTSIKASVHPKMAVDESIPIDQYPLFFEDARLNFAENMLCGKDDDIAIIEMDESNLDQPMKYSWRTLRDLVAKCAQSLNSSGVRQGDVVAVVGGNCARSLALLLATAAVGGIFASFSTDIGDLALYDRLEMLKPRVLIAESTYSYNGKKHTISKKLDSALERLRRLRGCEAVIVGPRDGMRSKTISFDQFQEAGVGAESEFVQVPFNTPFVVMFSSGTTGTPKGIVHSQGGLMLNGIKEHLFHNNLGPEDIHYQYTNIGWTLWNISLGALFCGTTLVLYEGSPFYTTPERFLEGLFQHRITSFGAGPRYYSELQKRDIKVSKFNIDPVLEYRGQTLAQYLTETLAPHLHTIVSTGAVLTPSLASWLAESFGPVCQVNMSGGTELCGSFVHGTRTLPSFAGEMAVKALGMDVAVFRPDGSPAQDGESGELVCRKPFPNMPVMFWGDPDRRKYHASCFEGFPHVWTHGDFIKVNPETNGVSILGRSDGVLNPSGVRFASSDIYNILSSPEFCNDIIDALAVGQQRVTPHYSDPTERVLLFVKCDPSSSTGTLLLGEKLEAAIRARITRDLSRRHVPSFFFEVDEIPYNVNGKKLEIPVKKVISGGADVLAKLKMPAQEHKQMAWFAKFYDIEAVEQSLKRGHGAKL